MDCNLFRGIFGQEILDEQSDEVQKAFNEHGVTCQDCREWMDAEEARINQEPVGRLLEAVRQQGLQKDRKGYLASPYRKQLESQPPENDAHLSGTNLGDGIL